jgi:hypothetical protein
MVDTESNLPTHPSAQYHTCIHAKVNSELMGKQRDLRKESTEGDYDERRLNDSAV